MENFVIQKDLTKITLASGKIWFTKPSQDGARPTGACFSGEGRIQMTPPIKIERDAMKMALDKDSLDEKFTQAFIRFNDDLYDHLKDKITTDSSGGDQAARLFKERQKALEDLGFNSEYAAINDMVTEGPRVVQFLFEFEIPKQGWIAFLHSPGGVPFEIPGESLYFRPQKVVFSENYHPIITVFHEKSEYDSGKDLGHEDRDAIWIRHYSGEIKVEKDGLVMKPSLDIDIESMFDGLRAMQMQLLSWYGDEQHAFTVQKVTGVDGKPLEFLHTNHELIVLSPKGLKKGEKIRVHVEYTADFIRPDEAIGSFIDDPDIPSEVKPLLKAKLDPLSQDYATFTLLNTYPWFPQAGFLKRHTLDWTVKVPTPFIPVASGTTKKRWKEEGYNCLQTVENVPVALASVLFGRYVEKTDSSARPAINVFTLPKQQKQADDLLAEARSIVTSYEKWFGPFPFDELDIAQMGFQYGFGQAPPGLVQLTGEAFLSGGQMSDIFGGNSGFVHAFVAHEIGHEWWGHAVSWANPNDQWLSESYTEYCSALYVQSSIGQKAFENKLRRWRDSASHSKDSGPIWLASRLGKHYTTQTYDKGPYVLHMLRLALQAQAVATGGTVEDGDRMFFESLKSFIEKFRNQNATTLDFQKVVNATSKVNMDWFFDQWFRGNNWMNLEFKYEVRPTEDGKFLLVATFRQPDKDNVKQMTVPMYIHFKDKVMQRMIFVNKADQVVQLKLPVSPQKVTLDDKKDLLADIKYN